MFCCDNELLQIRLPASIVGVVLSIVFTSTQTIKLYALICLIQGRQDKTDFSLNIYFVNTSNKYVSADRW